MQSSPNFDKFHRERLGIAAEKGLPIEELSGEEINEKHRMLDLTGKMVDKVEAPKKISQGNQGRQGGLQFKEMFCPPWCERRAQANSVGDPCCH